MNTRAPLPGAVPAAKKKRDGLRVVVAGLACEILGFIFLAQGSMTAAPALIVGSFAVMGLGIYIGWD